MKKIILTIIISMFLSLNISYSATCTEAYNHTAQVLEENFEIAVANCPPPDIDDHCIAAASFEYTGGMITNVLLLSACCTVFIFNC